MAFLIRGNKRAHALSRREAGKGFGIGVTRPLCGIQRDGNRKERLRVREAGASAAGRGQRLYASSPEWQPQSPNASSDNHFVRRILHRCGRFSAGQQNDERHAAQPARVHQQDQQNPPQMKDRKDKKDKKHQRQDQNSQNQNQDRQMQRPDNEQNQDQQAQRPEQNQNQQKSNKDKKHKAPKQDQQQNQQNSQDQQDQQNMQQRPQE